MNELTAQQLKDLKTLAHFIRVYCHAKHDRKSVGEVRLPEKLQKKTGGRETICRECADLLTHGMQKRKLCPLDPKPTCKKCHIHCYSQTYRQKIREIMAFSGRKMLLRGRIDYLWHYFFN